MKNKYRKFSFATISVAAVASAFAGVVSADTPSFKDVPTNHPYFEEIETLHAAGIIDGDGKGYFHPKDQVTRGQLAKFIVSAFDLEVNSSNVQSFSDVPSNHIFYSHIQTLASLNIAKGRSSTQFDPEANVTREEIALFLTRALQFNSASTTTSFKDVEKYAQEINALYESKITAGKSADKFAPKDNATRAEVAAFITRALAFESERPYSLDILHVNDIHANSNKLPKLATAIETQRIATRDALLLNAGDTFSGTLYFNEFLGQAELTLLNELNFDAFVFGNHEFDLGSSTEGHKKLVEFIKGSNYPFLSANVDFSKDSLFNGLQSRTISSSPEDGKIYDAIIKEVKGEKVGIIGLTTSETKDIASPGSVVFENYLERTKAQVAALEAKGVNKIIALTHIGYDDNVNYDNDLMLAKAVEGIDVIVGGHTHTELKEPVVVDKKVDGSDKAPTIIVQAYQYADYLGTVNVEFDEKGQVVKYRGNLIGTSSLKDQATLASKLKPFADRIAEISNKEIGVSTSIKLSNPRSSEKSPESVRSNETILGNLVTDGMLKAAKEKAPSKNIIMAVQNGGGIRAAIDEGPITVGEVISVLPFGNTLGIVDLTGAEIKAMFEHSVSQSPKENGGFLHIAGGKIKFDSTKPVGERIVSVQYKNEAGEYVDLDLAATYTIATNAFTIKGGDGFTMLEKAYAEGRATDFGASDWENFQNHLNTLGDLTEENAKIEGRIINIAQ